MTETNGRGKVAVVGAGLGGALMAARLGQSGYQVSLYEMRGDPRGRDLPAGKSINLAISIRGLHALDEIGLKAEILKIAVPMQGRMIHSPTGETVFQPYGTEPDDAINSVSRGMLNLKLIEAAAACDGLRLHFSHKCTRVALDEGRAVFQRSDTKESVSTDVDFVVGGDGAFSAVRRSMQRLDRFDYSQSYLEHGYKELYIPPANGGGHRLEKNALHIWPRKSFMMIALPNFDGSFTCTLFFPFAGDLSFACLRTDDDVKRFFDTQFPDAVEHMPTLLDDFSANPTSSLVTIRCGPWYHRDKVVLLGDACHAVVPFYGQGANAAFEDCTILGACLDAMPGDRAEAFRAYDQSRRVHVNALADLAIENFVEMRDRTGSRLFLAKKKFEKAIHKLFPRSFLPLYSMVTFSRIPYADAVSRARRQWQAVRAVVVIAVMAILIALCTILR